MAEGVSAATIKAASTAQPIQLLNRRKDTAPPEGQSAELHMCNAHATGGSFGRKAKENCKYLYINNLDNGSGVICRGRGRLFRLTGRLVPVWRLTVRRRGAPCRL